MEMAGDKLKDYYEFSRPILARIILLGNASGLIMGDMVCVLGDIYPDSLHEHQDKIRVIDYEREERERENT